MKAGFAAEGKIISPRNRAALRRAVFAAGNDKRRGPPANIEKRPKAVAACRRRRINALFGNKLLFGFGRPAQAAVSQYKAAEIRPLP